ncbi:hypothetical protein BSZ39_08750 [Bowdeniella nasicola]|uniref:M23ase beta-sheet core domain-containing protein n=1 Tax=Bowdeniella nasicola TaxID=208480 RepID=A0A1Q5Q1A0_9ACTO|nr:M23 family metallopeptidase [Bowdeniella nasicola]OKL53577.1 hypothetical protein BSZ39_08750 [Bowdeniella nasicola]
MTICAHDNGATPLTRRQIRERKRATLAKIADAVASDEAEKSAAPDTTDQTATLPVLTRRELRLAQPKKRTVLAPRLAIAASLGALTIAAPLTGFIGSQEGATAQALPNIEPTTSHIVPAVSGFAEAVVSNEAEGTAAVPSSLQEDPVAATRATTLSASRTLDRTIGACETPIEGASGLRSALQKKVERSVVMPMTAGSYRNTSPYGTRVHPIFGTVSKHEGTDMAAPVGTPIHAVADGTVIHAGNGIQGRSSMLVIIEHEINGQKVQTWYVHMFRNGVYVSEGQKVKAGDVIGGVGNYGNSTGPHLHFEVHTGPNMQTVDPLPWLKQVGAVNPGAC